jgi:hypothetical protein
VKRPISFATFAAAFGAASAGSAMAAELNVTVEVPRIPVAEYHAPYVALWIEKPDATAAGTLAVRFRPNHEKWLKDMRQWWRKSGREMTYEADGLSGPTRAPGLQKYAFSSDNNELLKALQPGQYTLVVDAAREAGGYESVRVPFTWGKPAKPKSAKGSKELGAVTVAVN